MDDVRSVTQIHEPYFDPYCVWTDYIPHSLTRLVFPFNKAKV